MLQNLAESFALTMKWEGGAELSLTPKDPGNWTGGKVGVGVLKGTKWGVSAAAYPDLDIKGLSEAQACAIFKAEYWDQVAADHLPAGMDHCVSDDAYNSGTGEANRLYGAVIRQRLSDGHAQIAAFSAARLSFLRSLRTWNTFKSGWSARVAGVKAESLRMSGAPAAVVQSHASAAKATSSFSAGGAAVGGAIAAGTAAAGPTAAHLPWQAAVVVAFALVAAAVFVWRARARAHRAEALQNLAAATKGKSA